MQQLTVKYRSHTSIFHSNINFMIHRAAHLQNVNELLNDYPVVGLIGARQVGKTTLAREILGSSPGSGHVFDLEASPDRARLNEPLLALGELSGLVVLDEVQRMPDVFQSLRVLADRNPLPARFLVLGSASPDLLRQSSESLAGRIAYYELPTFSLTETTVDKLDDLWLRGGFPPSFLARSDPGSYRWRQNLVRTFLERDIPQLGIRLSTANLERFWAMLAHYHGQTWNGVELARAFGVSDHTVRNYLETLRATFMVRVLQPWFANTAKRQVKSPKVYIRDSGILHQLLGIQSRANLERHPQIGASWEGFILENLISQLQLDERECFFWGAHSGSEIDLVVNRDNELRGFEIKRTLAPTVTRSMRTAYQELNLSSIDVIHAGESTFPLQEKIRAVAATRMIQDIN